MAVAYAPSSLGLCRDRYPAVFMYIMSAWALTSIIRGQFSSGKYSDPVAWIAVVLMVLAVLMLIEAIVALLRTEEPTKPHPALAPA